MRNHKNNSTDAHFLMTAMVAAINSIGNITNVSNQIMINIVTYSRVCITYARCIFWSPYIRRSIGLWCGARTVCRTVCRAEYEPSVMPPPGWKKRPQSEAAGMSLISSFFRRPAEQRPDSDIPAKKRGRPKALQPRSGRPAAAGQLTPHHTTPPG
jgi:hypothetical protein